MYWAFVVLTLLLCGSQLSAIAAEPQHITIDRSEDGSISHTVSRFSVPFLGDQTGKEPVSYHYVKDIPRPLYRLAQLNKVIAVHVSLTSGKWRGPLQEPPTVLMPYGSLLSVTYEDDGDDDGVTEGDQKDVFHEAASLLSGLFCTGSIGSETWRQRINTTVMIQRAFTDKGSVCTENLSSLDKFLPDQIQRDVKAAGSIWPLRQRYQNIQLTLERKGDIAEYTFRSAFQNNDEVVIGRPRCLQTAYTIEGQSWTDGTLVLTAVNECDKAQQHPQQIALHVSETLKPLLHRASFVDLSKSSTNCNIGIARIDGRTLTLDVKTSGAGAHCQLKIPVTKTFRTWTQFRPDAERGVNSMPAVHVEDGTYVLDTPMILSPTPDFSMPYNVLSMTSTVIALFFGNVINALLRRHQPIKVTP